MSRRPTTVSRAPVTARSGRRVPSIWDAEHGVCRAGVNGRATHVGAPLTHEQIAALPEGAEVTITWIGGNGPWPYVVAHDRWGRIGVAVPAARGNGLKLIDEGRQHRVTAGWSDEGRAWAAEKTRRAGLPPTDDTEVIL